MAAEPEYREVLARLKSRLLKRLGELNDPRANNPDYDEFDKYPYLGGGGGSKGKK